MDIEETKKKIEKIIPKESEEPNIIFDPQRSIVVIETEKPGIAIGKGGDILKEIKKETLWTPIVKRLPPMRSRLIENIRQVLYDSSDYRRKFLHKVGKRVYEGWTKDRRDEWVRITCLGSAREVGRSCFLLQTPESRVLLDCGFDVASPKESAFPYLDAAEFDINELDAIILCHSHIDHCLPPETPIELENGIIKPIDQIKEGDKVLTMNWKTGKKEIGECVEKIRTYNHKEIIKVKTPYYTIDASPNHKFFIIDNMKIKEIEAKDLKEGMIIPCNSDINNEINNITLNIDTDYRERIPLSFNSKLYLKKQRERLNLSQHALSVALNKSRNFIYLLEGSNNHIYKDSLNEILRFYKLNEKEFYLKFGIQKTNLPERLNTNLAQCIGYIAGDGHQSTENSIRITDKSKECLEEYSETFYKIFNYKPGINHHSDKTKNAFVIEINNAGILRYIKNNFNTILKESPKRKIPDQIILSSNEIICSFIRGFADAEGCVKKRVIVIDSTSIEIAEKLQFILNRLGIESTLSKQKINGYRKEGISYRIGIGSVNAIRKFNELIGFRHPEKNRKLKDMINAIKETNAKEEDFIPINNTQIKEIIKNISLKNNCDELILKRDLPKDVFALYSGDSKKLTRNTAQSLTEFLEKRINIIEETIIDSNIEKKILVLGVSKMELNKFILDKKLIVNKLDNLLKDLKDKVECKLNKIRFFINAEVKWQQITKIEKNKNEYKYLVDLKIKNNSNFIANGIVVHNCGTLPFLYKMGFRGPTYCTEPCRDISALMCLDLIGIAEKEGNDPPYKVDDVKEFVKHSICLDYGEVSDITPDIRLTMYNAGHTLGSALAHLHIGNGLHNFCYTSDFNYETSNLLGPANTRFPRIESVMMESTYGTKSDKSQTRKESEDELIKIINEIAANKGKVLMPVLGVGRSQEIMLILERAMKEKRIPDMTIYIQGMIWDINAIHTAYPDFLSNRTKTDIFQKDHNPFLSPIFKQIKSQKEMAEVKDSKGPFIVMATSGMLQGGPALEYFKHFAENPKNALVITCYQGVGSLGRRIQQGERDINFITGGSKRQENLKIVMKVFTLDGFSGHSNFKQLVSWVGNLDPRPKKIIMVHGEYSRCLELASVIYQQYRIETCAPKNLETIRLR